MKRCEIGAAVSEIERALNFAPERREELFGLVVDKYIFITRGCMDRNDFASPIEFLEMAERYAVTERLRERVRNVREEKDARFPYVIMNLHIKCQVALKEGPPSSWEISSN